jgi:hypothetical protein
MKQTDMARSEESDRGETDVDLLAGDSSYDPVSLLQQHDEDPIDIASRLLEQTRSLTMQEKVVIKLRYGLKLAPRDIEYIKSKIPTNEHQKIESWLQESESLTQEETALWTGVQRQRVGIVEQKAIQKMKSAKINFSEGIFSDGTLEARSKTRIPLVPRDSQQIASIVEKLNGFLYRSVAKSTLNFLKATFSSEELSDVIDDTTLEGKNSDRTKLILRLTFGIEGPQGFDPTPENIANFILKNQGSTIGLQIIRTQRTNGVKAMLIALIDTLKKSE